MTTSVIAKIVNGDYDNNSLNLNPDKTPVLVYTNCVKLFKNEAIDRGFSHVISALTSGAVHFQIQHVAYS